MTNLYSRVVGQSSRPILLVLDCPPYFLKIIPEIFWEIQMAHGFDEGPFDKDSRQFPYAHIQLPSIWNPRVNYHVLGTSEKPTFSMIWFDNN